MKSPPTRSRRLGFLRTRLVNIGSITPNSFGPNVGSILNQWTYSYKDVATKIIGNHTIKFGGELTRLFYLNECAGCGVPELQLLQHVGLPQRCPAKRRRGLQSQYWVPHDASPGRPHDIWGFFVQDDFKVRPNLTVNLGLRWSYFGPLSSKQGNMFVANPGAGANYMTDLTVSKGNSWNAQKDNFGPQIGFAWSPTRFNDKLVVRGGYGLSYNQEEIAISANIGKNPGLVVFPILRHRLRRPRSIPASFTPLPPDPHNLYGYPANPNAISSFGTNGLPTTGSVGVGIFPHVPPDHAHPSLLARYPIRSGSPVGSRRWDIREACLATPTFTRTPTPSLPPEATP